MKILMQLKEKDIVYLVEERTVRWETGMAGRGHPSHPIVDISIELNC